MTVKIEVDMEMPKSCVSCRFCTRYEEEKTAGIYRDRCYCEITGSSFWLCDSINNKAYDNERFVLCPLKHCKD